jgi:hypothetical protein
MNSPAPFDSGTSPTSPLKIPHRDPLEVVEVSTLSPAQRELAADMEALRERETNLREYEARLRAWQTQLDSRTAQPGSATEGPFVHSLSQMPFSSDSLLASSWEKFHRARALLESEQKQMRDERMMMREAEVSMKRREAELAVREELLAKREKLLTDPVSSAVEPKKHQSAVERLTKAPFFGTRSIFKPDK